MSDGSAPTDDFFVARVRPYDRAIHPVAQHLFEVAALSRAAGAKLGCPDAGELIGLVHDLGKHSAEFQAYIRSATGLLDPDDEEHVDAESLRGHIDHSTAGAQWIWRELSGRDARSRQVAELLALCVASHHGGLIDCVSVSASAPARHAFADRMAKDDELTHLRESLDALSEAVAVRVRELLDAPGLVDQLVKLLDGITSRNPSQVTRRFEFGLAARFLLSGLIDADRISAADFEHIGQGDERQQGAYTPWPVLIDRLEGKLAKLAKRLPGPIDLQRREVADACLASATRCTNGVYTLTAPTGSGKTLAMTRFALHHAQKRGLDRIVYVLPFTSIIDQNAATVRCILEPDDAPEEQGRVVLEHHSNLTPERETWRARLLSEDWDAPVVFTTMVQFLEACFGGGTRGVRRMHQLANAVVIFDEVQALPVRCAHLFANAVNFLAEECNSTVVFSTATQPLLDRIDAECGAVRLSGDALVPDVADLFERLKRVDITSDMRPRSADEIAMLAIEEARAAASEDRAGSALVIANTRKAAQEIYRACAGRGAGRDPDALLFLSAAMCPAHRRERLDRIRSRLESGLPVICVSTQVIEAGIDVDFDSVIRCLAGLDSVAQAAGRCNRHGLRDRGRVTVVRYEGERLGGLVDIERGAEAARRVLQEIEADPGSRDDPLGPAAIELYYRYYFFDRAREMSYHVSRGDLGPDTLLNLLSRNTRAMQDRPPARRAEVFMAQSFKEAGRLFQAIAPTEGVIVPFDDEARRVIAGLRRGGWDARQERALLRRAQVYSVNVYPSALRRMVEYGMVTPVGEGRVHVLEDEDGRLYDEKIGLDVDHVSFLEGLMA